MKAQGRLHDISKTIDGQLLLSFTVEASLTEIEPLREAVLDITATKHRNKRSNNANSYLWVLCDKIAKKVGATNKDRIYMNLLRDYGVWEDVLVRTEAAEHFLHMNSYAEVMYDIDGWTCVRVYHGSHEYDTKEMSELIDGAVTEAQLLGIDTMTPDELSKLKSLWRGL